MSLSLIVAMDRRGGIGYQGHMPWPRLKVDMQHFRAKTTCHTVVMGRKTYESLGKPLPDRHNVVVTSGDISHPDVEVVRDPREYFAAAAALDEVVWVIGGAELYTTALPYVDCMVITRVYAVFDTVDTWFPDVEWRQWQSLPERQLSLRDDIAQLSLSFEYWQRIVPADGPLYRLTSARVVDQLGEMERLAELGICYFCDLLERKIGCVIDGEYWAVYPNTFPYKNTSVHMLIVPKAHHVDIRTLTRAASAEYMQVVAQVADSFGLTGYSQFMRSGDMSLTGASIAHLHGHVIAPDMETDTFESVKIKLGTRG